MGFDDPNDEGNSSRYHTGKECVEAECHNPAGTAWSPYWCFECNVKRMKGIAKSLQEISDSFKADEQMEVEW